MKKLILFRRISQTFFFCLFVYILWSTTYPLKGLLPPETFFTINPFIIIMTSLAERIVLAGIIFSVLMILLTLVAGRFFCGWVCPLGTAIDIAGSIRRPPVLSDRQNKKIRRVKFVILGMIFILALGGIQAAWVFDPMVIMARFVSLNLIPTVTVLIDAVFSWVIRIFGLYGSVYDVYRSLKSSLLGVQVHYFAHSVFIFSVFLAIFYAAIKLKRSWCRVACPLGAIFALVATGSWLTRQVQECKKCGKCKADCPMGAIQDDLGYVKPECILCMDCVYGCPQNKTFFSFSRPVGNQRHEKGISRRDFLILGFLSLGSLMGFRRASSGNNPMRQRVIRPPASLAEEEFLNRCVRCGNCMKVCITNGLQPAMFEAGPAGVWTPRLVPEIGYCEYRCTLCGNVCPTGAIPKLSLQEKLKTRIGIAKIDRSLCLPWKKKKPCIVCEEHCPIPNKAIKLKTVNINGKIISRPYVNPRLCTGCAICQTKCPTRPKRAISIYPVQVTHADSNGKISKF